MEVVISLFAKPLMRLVTMQT